MNQAFIVKVQKYYLKKKVTETVASGTAKIINEKEIALSLIKILEHILITLCQLRDIAGSRDVIK